MGAFDNYHATSNLSGVIVSFPAFQDFKNFEVTFILLPRGSLFRHYFRYLWLNFPIEKFIFKLKIIKFILPKTCIE
mgnify:CR=1 FL=1